jgi:hypothetical protein
MSLESGVVVGLDGSPLYWHLPLERTAGSLPNSRPLWDVFWEHRDNLLGFAHSHPGVGIPAPSQEDRTTFSAVERGLGKRLSWWICTETHLCLFVRLPEPTLRPDVYVRMSEPEAHDRSGLWLRLLRAHSYA